MHYSKVTYSCKIIAGIVFMLAGIAAQSQSFSSQQVEVTDNKTSSIVFPVSITSVDRGSRDVLAQKVKGVTNVLHVKAGRQGFSDTNLTVIASDGRIHHFFVRYADQPFRYITRAVDSS